MKVILFLLFTIFAIVASAHPITYKKLVNRQVPPANQVFACNTLTETPDGSGNVYLTCVGNQTTGTGNRTTGDSVIATVAFLFAKTALCAGVETGITTACA